MKRLIFMSLLLFMTGGGLLHAQGVKVQINGDQSFLLNESNGLYFHNDSLTVDGVSFALDDIQVITFQASSGITETVAVEDITLAPNPVRDAITLRGIGDTPQRVSLYSTAGIKIMEQMASDGEVINISHLPEGVYILRCGERVAKMVKQM